MNNNTDARAYGAELGEGIKQGLQGLNTVCSPKKRKTAIKLLLIPLVLSMLFLFIGVGADKQGIASIGIVFGFCLGVYQFYVGRIKRGIIYTVTFGGLYIGAIIDLFKLAVTKTFRDANGFPLIY